VFSILLEILVDEIIEELLWVPREQ